MRQDPEEPFRTFAAHVQGKAESCEFKTDYHDICSGCQAAFNGNVYHTDEIVRDVLLNGIADVDIRREALSAYSMQKKPINEVITFIESKETARNANPASGVSAISTYRRNHKPLGENSQRKSKFTPTQTDREKTRTVGRCSTFSRRKHMDGTPVLMRDVSPVGGQDVVHNEQNTARSHTLT